MKRLALCALVLVLLFGQPAVWMGAKYGWIGLGPQPRFIGTIDMRRRVLAGIEVYTWTTETRRCILFGEPQTTGSWQTCLNWR